ncbi:uncharacterized protein V1510DRAFT_360341 [Dipodascopsis tothii]|uniref:uncharacterized protein n=1 Tax=Dipodascopsis tothii TaxID=44089 RepID=UPI0034CFD407
MTPTSIRGIRHSDSTTALRPIPMWDSSDPERRPPPLPLSDSPVLAPAGSSPTRASPLYAGNRSRTSSPTKFPGLSSAAERETAAGIADMSQQLVKLLDIATGIDATSRHSDVTIQRAEMQVDSLLRRSKDNASDLVALKENIHNTESALRKQVQELKAVLDDADAVAAVHDAHKAAAAAQAAKTDVEAVQARLAELAGLVGQIVAAGPEAQEQAQTLADAHSEALGALARQIDSGHAALATQSQLGGVEAKLERLEDVNAKLDRLDDVDSKLERLEDVHTKLDRLDDIHTKLGRLEDVHAKLDRLDDVHTKLEPLDRLDNAVARQHTDLAGLRDELAQSVAAVPAAVAHDVLGASRQQAELYSAKLEAVLGSRLDAAPVVPAAVVSSLDELRTLAQAAASPDSTANAAVLAKLDTVVADLTTLSNNMEPLSLLPEIHASFLDSAAQFNSYIVTEHSSLMKEVQDMQSRRVELAAELARLETSLDLRSREFERLEARADSFYAKLTESYFERSKASAAMGTPYGKVRAAKPALNVLSESPMAEDHLGSLSNITNGNDGDGSPERVGSVGHGRKVSWGKKFGSMFTPGKENELAVAKRGSIRRGGRRSASEHI